MRDDDLVPIAACYDEGPYIDGEDGRWILARLPDVEEEMSA